MQKKIKNDLGVIILAAGEAKRMGYPKPFLMYDEHQTFIDKIISEYEKFGCHEINIVINKKAEDSEDFDVLNSISERINIITNMHLEYERFYSIKLGLENLKRCSRCFIQNSDNPFVNVTILDSLYRNKLKDGYVVPVFEGQGGHPILIGEKIIDEALKAENDSNLKEFIGRFSRKNIEIKDSNILLNINTPVEYERIFKRKVN